MGVVLLLVVSTIACGKGTQSDTAVPGDAQAVGPQDVEVDPAADNEGDGIDEDGHRDHSDEWGDPKPPAGPAPAAPAAPAEPAGSAPSSPPAGTGPTVYNLTVLHPDTARSLMYSTNYQQGGLIPICSKITVVSRDAKQAVLEVDGKRWRYVYDKYLRETHDQHFARYFGAQCDPGEGLSAKDLEGIKAGKALEGMTRAGVIKAMGYPPPHGTKDMAGAQWKYWKSRYSSVVITFDGDVVVSLAK